MLCYNELSKAGFKCQDPYSIGGNKGSSSGMKTNGSSLNPNNFIFFEGGGLVGNEGRKGSQQARQEPTQSTHWPQPALGPQLSVKLWVLSKLQSLTETLCCPDSLEMATAKALASHLAYTPNVVLLTHTRHLSFHYSLCSQCTGLLLSHRPAQSGLQDSSLRYPQSWMLWSSWALKIYSVPVEGNKFIFIIKQ